MDDRWQGSPGHQGHLQVAAQRLLSVQSTGDGQGKLKLSQGCIPGSLDCRLGSVAKGTGGPLPLRMWSSSDAGAAAGSTGHPREQPLKTSSVSQKQMSESLLLFSLKSYPTLCDPMDYSPPDSSVHEISQARILEWVAISFSRASSQPRD